MWVSRETTISIWTCLWILYNIQLLKILREVAEKFFRYKMPKTLLGDVAVRTATLLWSFVNSVGSFLTSQMGTFVFIWWVKRICSQSKNLAESQHKTEIWNNIHWKWILLWIFKYFYWLSDLKSYLSLFAGLSNPLLSWESSHSQVRGSQEFSLSLTMHAAGKLYTHAKPGFWKVWVPYPQNTHCKLFLPCKEHLLQNLGCDASLIKREGGGKVAGVTDAVKRVFIIISPQV